MNAIHKIKTLKDLVAKLDRKFWKKSYDKMYRSEKDNACLIVATMAYIASSLLSEIKKSHTGWNQETDSIKLAMAYLRSNHMVGYVSNEEIHYAASVTTNPPRVNGFAKSVRSLVFREYYITLTPKELKDDIFMDIDMLFESFNKEDVLNQFKVHLLAYDFDFDDMEFKR